MNNNDFAPADRTRFLNEIDQMNWFKKWYCRLNNFLTVRAANRLNKEAVTALYSDNDNGFYVARYQADILWAQVYGVKMWEPSKEN